MAVVGCFFFFFSSRRRHTRSKRDWSSDVCSSDLGGIRVERGSGSDRPLQEAERSLEAGELVALRSEERRVGKECTTRRAASRKKKRWQAKRASSRTHNRTTKTASSSTRRPIAFTG